MIETMRETLVFAYDTPEQRNELMAMFPEWMSRVVGLRLVAASSDNEVSRVGLIEEAFNGPIRSKLIDFDDAIQTILDHEDVKSFKWSEVTE